MAAFDEAEVAATARVFLIDALNVAYWCGAPPSLRLPLALLHQLLADGHSAELIFDASARYPLAAERSIYQPLLQQRAHCIEVPSGRTADGVLLREARKRGACIISRDRFRDHRRRYRKLIDDDTRLLAGFVANDLLQVPALGLSAALATTAEAAWQLLQRRLPCAGDNR